MKLKQKKEGKDMKDNNELAVAIAELQRIELEIAFKDEPDALNALYRLQD